MLQGCSKKWRSEATLNIVKEGVLLVWLDSIDAIEGKSKNSLGIVS